MSAIMQTEPLSSQHPEPLVSSNPSKPILPLFYADPEPLAAARHGAWRLLAGSADFASAATAIPLVLSDFTAASHSYPILFTSGEAAPVALVGLEQANLFVDGGKWDEGSYVPAYVRRYPFVLIEAADKSGFGLAIDAASPQVARDGEAGEPLFDGDKPAAVSLRALEFCRLFNADFVSTQAFCTALAEQDLLVDRKADVTLPGGRKLGVAGFRVIDPERFAALPEDKLVAWHRNGWLTMIHCHLASLYRFADLLVRQGRREAVSSPTDAAPAPALSSHE